MKHLDRFIALSIVGAMALSVAPLAAAEGFGDFTRTPQERCERLSNDAERYDRCIERATKHAERRAVRQQIKENCSDIQERDKRRTCAQQYLPTEVREARAKIREECGERGDEGHRDCVRALKESGELPEGLRKMHSRGKRGRGYGRFGRGSGRTRDFSSISTQLNTCLTEHDHWQDRFACFHEQMRNSRDSE